MHPIAIALVVIVVFAMITTVVGACTSAITGLFSFALSAALIYRRDQREAERLRIEREKLELSRRRSSRNVSE